MDDKDSRIKELEAENLSLKEELENTKQHLKRYTNPERKQRYYEKNKELVIEKSKKYKSTAEQRKVYNRKSYLNRKAKLAQEKMDGDGNIEE